MIRIANNGAITMLRGDSFKYPLYINKGTRLSPREYKLHSKDIVYFSICEPNKEFELGIFRRKITNSELNALGRAELVISPEDSMNLLPGVYYLLVRIKLYNGNVAAITPKKKFIILE